MTIADSPSSDKHRLELIHAILQRCSLDFWCINAEDWRNLLMLSDVAINTYACAEEDGVRDDVVLWMEKENV
jgi:hypothetical protein